MAAILHRQPLTIKQQVEELKNWHKQQQCKVDPKSIDKENLTSKIRDNRNISYSTNPSCDSSSNSRINFDEIPIKVTNSNFITLVENNVDPVHSYPTVETKSKPEESDKPKFRFLKKGEGIARFNMDPPKIGKKNIPHRQNSQLKLTKKSTKTDPVSESKDIVNDSNKVDSEKNEGIPTLKAPDLKLNFTWKNILSGGNPEDMLEKVISSNHLEMMDPNSSMDSSTFSLMEKLLAIGKNRLSRDREELRVFEEIEQHMLDSSFCSSSSYVNKLMENAVMSTPDKRKIEIQQYKEQSNTSLEHSNRLPAQLIQNENEENRHARVLGVALPTLPIMLVNSCDEKVTKINEESESCENKDETNHKTHYSVGTLIKPTLNRNGEVENSTLDESSMDDSEESLHVRFDEKVDYKSFVEQSQSIDSESQREYNGTSEFDESHEWNEDSSSCCSQCSNQESIAQNSSPLIPMEKQIQTNQYGSQNGNINSQERLQVGDLVKNDNLDKSQPFLNNDLNNFPPLLLTKLKELEEEIKIFREENSNIKALRESLERERKQIQEEKRRVNLEKKKLNKEIEEEHKRLKTQFEEEKQKLAKEKITFEKYSKSLTKNPNREERKEIQALREQLTEIKEDLNKKESRWGAAQARVRNQVKVLEEDNRKLREEIEHFRKQAKYWDLFNQKKKGKPFNNTKLIHAISEHISNIVLDDENTGENHSKNKGYFTNDSSASKISTLTQSDLQSIYGVKVIKENRNGALPNDKNSKDKDISERKVAFAVTLENNSRQESDSCENIINIPDGQAVTFDERSHQNEDKCEKPRLESSKIIKEVLDENGNIEITFPNGNIKKINKITGSEKYIYINGDVEEITHDGTIKYYFSKSRIWQTTLPDGLEIFDFPDGKVEKRHIDGTIEVVFPNNNKKITYPNRSQEIIYVDGTRLRIEADKTQILTLPNGQREIHTEEWKRRDYPDGTKKTLYPDGTTETVYSNGRVRLKDKYGNLVMDSGSPSYD